MIFTQWPFAVFALVFFPLYFLTRGMLRIAITLIASYIFYSWWDWRFLSLLILTTLVDYLAAIKIDETDDQAKRKRWIVVSMSANLIVLGFFKYFNFFIESMAALLSWAGIKYSLPVLNVVLPIGISFYTFQSMSYTIDVYRRQVPAERNLIVFATCVAIFPHLVAGPIIRASRLIPQVRMHHDWDWPRIARGLEWVMWGFFLKMVVADNLAPLVDARFAHPENYGGAHLALGALGFAFQIYGDFAGYSLIAIGLGRIMGLNFGRNFNRPYFATDFSDFWRRWHISLSSWLRDYLYIPLGGSRHGTFNTYRNLILTMFLGGLWHGANWTFVVWGLLHGFYLVVQRALGSFVPERLAKSPYLIAPRILGVFFFVCVAWVFFRAQTLSGAIDYLSRTFTLTDFFLRPREPDISTRRIMTVLIMVVVVDCLSANMDLRKRYLRSPYLRAAGALLIVWAIIMIGRFDGTAFMYFQF